MKDHVGSGNSVKEQERLLNEALQKMKAEAFEMKCAMDKSRINEALKHASVMLSELRTSCLTPKYYYQLYIDITNELQHLAVALADDLQKGHRDSDLYEIVQYTNNIIPRLYLLITVGMVLMKLNEVDRAETLKDLVEMCTGVQHPLRGLFLRNYLLQCTRDFLPDQKEDTNGDPEAMMKNSINFILENFAEMNKLWVRMQHQGQSKEKERREKERRELQILVGTNLVRLSQLEHLNLEIYRKTILPKILEQVVSCKDPIAQEYLMECIIQVFPDEFQVGCLNVFLKACAEMHPLVNIKNVLSAVIDRLTIYGSTKEGRLLTEDIKLFDVFSQYVSMIIQSRQDIATEDIIALQVSLLNLSMKCYFERTDFVDKVFETTTQLFQREQSEKIPYNGSVGKELTKLCRIPVDGYNNVLTLLKLPNYQSTLEVFDYRGRIQNSLYITANMLSNETMVMTVEETNSLLTLLGSMIKDQPDQPADLASSDEFAEEQNSVARIFHLLRSQDADTQYLILHCARKHFGAGGSTRIKYVLVPIVFEAFRLAREYDKSEVKILLLIFLLISLFFTFTSVFKDDKWEKKIKVIFQFVHQTVSVLMNDAQFPDMALRLFLQGACIADEIKFESHEIVAYEYMSQAISIYEEEISDSRAQLAAITLIIGTLQKISCFSEENYDPLRTHCLLLAGKLFKKPDQCRAVATCSQLFWSSRLAEPSDTVKEGGRVVECLQKAVKIASQCMDPIVQMQLFTEVLNCHLYYSENGCAEVTVTIINKLMAKIHETLQHLEPSVEVEQISKHYENTVQHLRFRRENPTAEDPLDLAGLVL
ncbi:unnamed protein product [Soboliphyme baturini]|uniref:Vacuolar protein sorting-associated protein 35 n=1 Tax=Soboliphyme baturini TaxID=241478 RepID=A0A183IHV6_9BILA|nr:unnamed protein product [Soboliphyme baturini]